MIRFRCSFGPYTYEETEQGRVLQHAKNLAFSLDARLVRLLGAVLRHRDRDLTEEEIIRVLWDGDATKKDGIRTAFNQLRQGVGKEYFDKRRISASIVVRETDAEATDPAEAVSATQVVSAQVVGNSQSQPAPAVPIPVHGDFDQLDRFFGREDDLDWLAKVGASQETRIAAIIGIGGNGKTALARNWVKQQIEKPGRKFSGVFEWQFYKRRSQDECAAELEKFLIGRVGASERRSKERAEDWLSEQIEKWPLLLLLDGIEVLQDARGGPTAGRLQNGPIRDLLELMCVSEAETGLAVITSRAPLSDFKVHEGLGYRERELQGLNEADGVALLRDVRNVEDAEKRKYVCDLKGHPLGLRTFALIVKQQPMRFGNAAAYLAKKLDLVADPGLKQRLEKILHAYEEGLEPLDREVLRTVSVFPAGCAGQTIADLLAVAASGESRIDPSQVTRRLQSLVNDGVLFGGGFAWREAEAVYSCHPIYREHFRANSNDLARVAAIALLGGHPPGFQPRNPAEAKPYLDAIEILTAAGDIGNAYLVFKQNLRWGNTVWEMGELRLALDCLNCFLADDRRSDYEAALNRGQFCAWIENYITLLMENGEWYEAERQVRRAEQSGDEWEPAGVIAYLRFRIEKEIGSPSVARASLLTYMKQGSPMMPHPAVFDLAEIERRLGRFDECCKLMIGWIRDTARNGDIAGYIAGLPDACELLARALRQANPQQSARLFRSCAWARDNYSGSAGEGARRAEFEIAKAEERWEVYTELARQYALQVQGQGNASSAATWRTAVAEGLNKSNKPAEAIREARRAMFGVHPGSWAHRAARIELARAWLLEGNYAAALNEAREVMIAARKLGDVLILRDAAEILKEIGVSLGDLQIVTQAEAELAAIWRLRNLPDGWDPGLDALPGEPGWDEHLSKLLIEVAGASNEAPQRLGAALVKAAQLGLASAIKTLAQQGAPLTAIDDKGNTALEIAATAGHAAAVGALLDSGLLPSAQGRGWIRAIVAAIKAGNDEIAGTLVDRLESPGDKLLRSWLLWATPMEGLRTASAIVSKASSIDATNVFGLHPFVDAAREGNLPLVKLLSDHVPNVDVSESDGETALIAAAKVGSLPVVEFLLAKGAKVDIVDDEDRTPVLAAIEGGHTTVAFRLIQRQSGEDPHSDRVRRTVVDAAARGRLDLVRLLDSIDAPLSGKDGRGWTPIVAAARAPAESVLRFLLEAKVDVNEADSDGETAFLAAAARGHLGILELLRSLAMIDIRDARGRTAISLAVENGHLAAVRLLKSFGLTARLEDPAIRSALRVAAEKGHTEVLLELLKDASPEDLSAIFPDRAGNVLVDGGVDANAIRSLVDDFAAEKDRENRLPSRNPTTLSEPAAQAQVCVVGLATNRSFAGLPLRQASHALTAAFRDWQKKATYSNLAEFDTEGVRWAPLPFLPGWRLALLPHKNGVAVPFVCNGQDIRLALAKNEWLYSLMNQTATEQSPEILKAYCRFFFTAVVGSLGAFLLVDQVDHVRWKPGAGQADRDRVERHLKALRYFGKAADGRHELRATVLFKNALFRTSVMIGKDWIQELTNEELLEEDLPVYVGRPWDLLVKE